MGTIPQAVMDHFAEAGVKYAHHDDATFLASFELSSGNAMLVCMCQEEAHRLIVRVLLPFTAPAARRSAAAELITRVNYRLALGSFEMDFRDGELAFRAAIDVQDDRLTPALVRNLVGCCLSTTDHFYPAVAAVALAATAPLEALARLDQPALPPPVPGGALGAFGLTTDPRERLN